MSTAVFVVGGVLLTGVLVFLWRTVVTTYRRLRGEMLVACPETERTAGVAVDARHAAFTSTRGKSTLRVRACTRWPERAGCGQECLSQIQRSPESCLVRTLLTEWYTERLCAFCSKPFRSVGSYDDYSAAFWHDRKPALLSPDGRIVEWREISVETFPDVLQTHGPVCRNCLIVETFRQHHPELTMDRPARRRLLHS